MLSALCRRTVLGLLHLPAEISHPLGEVPITDDLTSRADLRPLLGREIVKKQIEIRLTPGCCADANITEGPTMIEVVWCPLTLLSCGRKSYRKHHT
jgi:hypothetical protein